MKLESRKKKLNQNKRLTLCDKSKIKYPCSLRIYNPTLQEYIIVRKYQKHIKINIYTCLCCTRHRLRVHLL